MNDATGRAAAIEQSGRALGRPDSGFLVGALQSGSGKTTLTLGLLRALRRRGRPLAAFKCGPDYLDTGLQSLAAGEAARNLDLWLMGEGAVRREFDRACLAAGGGAGGRSPGPVAVLEGMMGLFDGHRDPAHRVSSADIALLLDLPVVLVVDAARLDATVAALAAGVRAYRPGLALAGVVLNRFSSSRSRRAVESALAEVGVPLFGCLPAQSTLAIPERHLGLLDASGRAEELDPVIEAIADAVEEHLAIDRLLEACRPAERAEDESWSGRGGPWSPAGLGDPTSPMRPAAPRDEKSGRHADPVRIAVARDEAFSFVYPGSIEALERQGARIAFFSPLGDSRVPDCDGLILPGGYPELHARRLAANRALLDDLRRRALRVPVWAECGGFMALCREIEDADGAVHGMAGVAPFRAVQTRRLQALGLRSSRILSGAGAGLAGMILRTHEFHYARVEPLSGAEASPLLEADGSPQGWTDGRIFASWQHAHFAGCPEVGEAFLARCRDAARSDMTACIGNAGGER